MGLETTLQLVAAGRVSASQRAAIMNAAYADYYVPIHVTNEQMAIMDQFYDVAPDRSVVARTPWECVGQALLALRGSRAWISGVGVVPEWRRRGVARAMMHHLIDQAAQAGAEHVLLEVIAENQAARRLYVSLGFRELRELLTWQRPADADPLPIPVERLVSVPAPELLSRHPGWHDQPPSWQREPASLVHMAPRLGGYRLDWRDHPAAYCIIGASEDNISLVDVGINPESGLLMPGRLLLQALSARYWGHGFSIMNVPADDALNPILSALGFRVSLRQLEMRLDLR